MIFTVTMVIFCCTLYAVGRGVEGWVPREQIISANDFEQIISDLDNLREISILIDVDLRIFDAKRARFFGKSFTVLKLSQP